MVTPVRDFRLKSVSANQAGVSEAKVSFMLLRGSYATVVLREIIKPSDPISSGF